MYSMKLEVDAIDKYIYKHGCNFISVETTYSNPETNTKL